MLQHARSGRAGGGPWTRDAAHVLGGAFLGAVLGLAYHRYARQLVNEDLDRYGEVRDFVTSAYVDVLSADEILDRALRGLVEGLDGYSRYYDAEQVAGVERETSGVHRGIGVVFAPLSPPGQVLFVQEGSPAAAAGIETGERVLSIGGHALEELSAGQVWEQISRGGQAIELVVADRAGTPRRVEVAPEELLDPTVRHARLLEGGAGRVGYLAITSFSRKTPEELDQALSGLGELDALVIDVRGNPGGVLEAAVQVANRFVADGLLVTHEGRQEVVEFRARPEQATRAGLPLAVLVDGESASASEVFAAALQDHRAAVLVGTPTYGKGVVQEVRRFGGRSAVKLTTAYYYTPARRNLERTAERARDRGLQPDLRVELREDEALAVERHLASYTPPPAALEALRAWEAELGVPLVPSHPPDRQLEAALALFRGERPEARSAASEEWAE